MVWKVGSKPEGDANRAVIIQSKFTALNKLVNPGPFYIKQTEKYLHLQT